MNGKKYLSNLLEKMKQESLLFGWEYVMVKWGLIKTANPTCHSMMYMKPK